MCALRWVLVGVNAALLAASVGPVGLAIYYIAALAEIIYDF